MEVFLEDKHNVYTTYAHFSVIRYSKRQPNTFSFQRSSGTNAREGGGVHPQCSLRVPARPRTASPSQETLDRHSQHTGDIL